MRPVEWNIVPPEGPLVLLTMDDVVDGIPAQMADFRDSKALVHRRTGRWMGLGRRGIRLGSGVPELRDGIWFVREDPEAAERIRDLDVGAEDLVLKPIEAGP